MKKVQLEVDRITEANEAVWAEMHAMRDSLVTAILHHETEVKHCRAIGMFEGVALNIHLSNYNASKRALQVFEKMDKLGLMQDIRGILINE